MASPFIVASTEFVPGLKREKEYARVENKKEQHLQCVLLNRVDNAVVCRRV